VREGQMLRSAVALMMMCGCAAAYVVGCHVEPVQASWSGHTDSIGPYDGVSQTVTCNFDSLSYVELFAGAKGNGGSYHVAVYDSGTVRMWADGTQYRNESWVRFENWNTHVAFTKGKQYVFRFSRAAGSDYSA